MITIISKDFQTYLHSYFEKFKEDTNIQSITFLAILAPIFFISMFLRYDSKIAYGIIISGFMQGTFYALIALGFSIIFGIARMFKLSIGGYFVLGAYTALWLRQMTLMQTDTIMNAGVGNSTDFMNTTVVLMPLILLVVGFVILIKNFSRKEFAGTMVLLNVVFLIVQRGLLRSNFGTQNFKSIIHASIIQISLIYFALVLIYFELAEKQVLIGNLIMNIIMVLVNLWKIDYPPALYFSILLLSMMIVAGVSMLVDRYVLNEIRSNPTNVLIVTFGVALIIQSILPLISFPTNGEFTRFDIVSRDLYGVVLKTEHMVILGTKQATLRIVSTIISILLIASVLMFLQFTRMGKAMRAVAQDEDAAWLVGINVRKVYLVTTGLGMGLVAAAAVLTTPYEAKPIFGIYMGWTPLVFAIAVVTLGGLGSIMGSVVAGLIIGFTESYVAYNDLEMSSVVPLIIIFLVMLVRPDGLFGMHEEDE